MTLIALQPFCLDGSSLFLTLSNTVILPVQRSRSHLYRFKMYFRTAGIISLPIADFFIHAIAPACFAFS